MLKNLLDYNSKENVYIRNHQREGYALCAVWAGALLISAVAFYYVNANAQDQK